MILTTSKILRTCGDQHMKEFISKTLTAFGNEFKTIAELMYRYPSNLVGVDQKEGVNDVFALIERS